MHALLALAQTTGIMAKWMATLCALAIACAHPAPRHTGRHHLPITLPELASID